LEDIIKVEGLTKQYGKFVAVDNISFIVKEGSLFAFLGPNGAGKSTTINMLSTVLEKTKGKIHIGGHEVGKEDNDVRKSIGMVFQQSMLDPLLTVKENLETRGSFYELKGEKLKKRIDWAVEATNSTDFFQRRYDRLSGGQKRRADIARALINYPKVLFLDEPTTGLDPQTRMHVWKTINNLRKREKMTIFLTTHYMEEAAVADDVAIIDNGKIVARDTPEKLKIKYSNDYLHILPRDEKLLTKKLETMNVKYEIFNDSYHIKVKNSMEGLSILKKIEDFIYEFEMLRGNMDDVFINITGKNIREEGGE